jgi:hypothetical protein
MREILGPRLAVHIFRQMAKQLRCVALYPPAAVVFLRPVNL